MNDHCSLPRTWRGSTSTTHPESSDRSNQTCMIKLYCRITWFLTVHHKLVLQSTEQKDACIAC
uniref:Uncharacterized protein n=1 Tax=Arundo donax TaxID=35708 RepID=A0A0A9FV60_ARUDO